MPLYGQQFPILAPAGTAAAPSYSFSSAPTSGLYYSGGVMNVSVGGTGVYAFGATSFYVGTNVSMSAAGSYNWETRSVMSSPSDGVIRLTNAAGDAFYRLQFGGSTSSFPALKRNGSGFACVKADDSALTDIQASLFYATIDGGGFFIGASADVALRRDAANVLALRNSTNAQTLRGYFSYTDASNYARWALNTASGVVELAAETAGSGADDIDVVLTPAGTGNVRFGTYGAEVALVAGYVTIKDAGGTTRKLAVIA